MKRVLFILPGLDHGGTNRSMKNLLGHMDNEEIDVDILALCGTGPYYKDFKEHLQQSVQAMTEAVGTLGKRRESESWLDYFHRFLWKLVYRIVFRRSNDSVFALAGKRLQKERYDTVIAFQEAAATHMAVHVPASKHIAWVRCDYSNYLKRKNSEANEESIYCHFDQIICVSEYTGQVFKRIYPGLSGRVKAIHNIIDTKEIVARSQEKDLDARFIKNGITLVSVGRFAPEKRFTEIPAMAAHLKRNGIPFRWYIIGDGGVEKQKTLSAVEQYDVADCVILLGEKKNPYPYIAAADLLVCPSYTEACPNVVNEARILHVPVVAADFPSATEFIDHDVNGFIVPIEEMADTLVRIYRDRSRYDRIKEAISGFEYDNAEIEKQIRELILGEAI